MLPEYQHIIDIMGIKPINDEGDYSSADIAEVNIILYEVEQATRAVLRRHGANV